VRLRLPLAPHATGAAVVHQRSPPQGYGQHAADVPFFAATALHLFSAQPPPLPIRAVLKVGGKLSMLLAWQLAPCLVSKHRQLPPSCPHGPLGSPEHTAADSSRSATSASLSKCGSEGGCLLHTPRPSQNVLLHMRCKLRCLTGVALVNQLLTHVGNRASAMSANIIKYSRFDACWQ
jgi:hypothetical protein